jgi:PPP family 3-phenylpropionic acid transporter
VRASGVAGTLVFLGAFAGESFALLCTVLFAMTFFWSAALPLVEATTLSHLGDETAQYGRIRVWGSVGFIAAVVAVGYLLDATSPRAVLWVIAGLMAGCCCHGGSMRRQSRRIRATTGRCGTSCAGRRSLPSSPPRR